MSCEGAEPQVVSLVELLEALGVTLEIEDGVLVANDPEQVVTSEVLTVLRRYAKPLRGLVEARAAAVEAAERLLEEARR